MMSRRKSRRGLVVLFAAILALFISCEQKAPPDMRPADESAIRSADEAWSKVTAAKDIEGHLAYYADDASVLSPNAPIATGKEALRTMISQFYAMPGFAVSWQPTKVEASKGGDFGYTVGTYEMSFNDPKGKPVTDRGKYVTIWKKQADGSWKVILDMFNSDLPLSASSK
jgi:ketosteroid isomerase-like protein